MCLNNYIMKNTTDPKGIPAILQDRNGSRRVRVIRYNDTYAAIAAVDHNFPSNGYESAEIVPTKDLVFLDNLI